MKSNYLIIAWISVVIVVTVLLLYPREQASGELDAFAQCLADKQITMYGAEWCSACQMEERDFGNSFRFVPYIECPDNPQKCIAAGIEGYPTWIFPDGTKLVGKQGIEKLSQISGCALPDPT